MFLQGWRTGCIPMWGDGRLWAGSDGRAAHLGEECGAAGNRAVQPVVWHIAVKSHLLTWLLLALVWSAVVHPRGVAPWACAQDAPTEAVATIGHDGTAKAELSAPVAGEGCDCLTPELRLRHTPVSPGDGAYACRPRPQEACGNAQVLTPPPKA